MKTTLKWSIKIFWAMIGAYCAYLLLAIFWNMLSGHFPRDLSPSAGAGIYRSVGLIAMWFLTLAMLLVAGLLAYVACLAWFRFSQNILGPTVLMVSVMMWCVAVHGQIHFIQPLIEAGMMKSHGLLMPIVGLLTPILILVGAIGFYRATLRILTNVLFPVAGIRYSAARQF